ncbi:prolyl oligopeptidase family serine peptidase [bacterium]|nr:prolyl oligopeptidase family serine peptidase [bacterium]
MNRSGRVTGIALMLLLLVVAAGSAQTVNMDQWLLAGPVTIPYADADEGLDVDPVAGLLETLPIDPFEFWPADGDPVLLGVGQEVTFGASDGMIAVSEDVSGTRFALLATYLSSPAWQEGKLSVVTQSPFALFIDGESAKSRTEFKDEGDTTKHKFVLDQGHHRVLLAVALSDTQAVDSWGVQVTYMMGEDTPDEWAPTVTLDPEHPYDIIDYFRSDNVSALAISPDGHWLAADISRRSRKDDAVTDKLEVWDTKDEELVWTYTAPKGVSNVAWAPASDRLLFKSGDRFFLWHRESNEVQRIDTEFEDAGQFKWSADGLGLFYMKTLENENEEDYQVVWKLADRWAGWRNHYAIQYYGIADGLDTRVCTMKYSPDAWVVGRDGKTLAFKRSLPLRDRPYEMLELLVYNLESGELKSVYQSRKQSWSTAMALSPDGSKIAFTAPMGEVPGDDSPPPYYNTGHQRLWILDIASGETELIDPEFKPSIHYMLYRTSRNNEFVWTDDNEVAFSSIYMKKVLYCTWSPGDDQISAQRVSTPGFSNLTIATGEGTDMIAYRGDVVDDLWDVHAWNSKREKGGVLIDLNEESSRLTIPVPRVEDYDYVNSDGVTVYGYLYYPRDYDESQSYPMLVETYGGVIGYGDSWQFLIELFANRGYFVYVPVPRGAVGYGQAYADTHANDWGILTSRDMNEGVRHIVANVPGVDGDKVAFASGSYGGFLAMYLLSMDKDDPDYYPYATAVSNYGISNLVSYWGVGWWGVHYSEKASTGSYPWNATQWYNDQSPIYQADNITVPLLLLHGEADTNVPVGESAQMFAALETLGRDVVYIKWPGENHGIASTRTKYLETKRMHIEWFDKYLRDQPGAWDKRMENEFDK